MNEISLEETLYQLMNLIGEKVKIAYLTKDLILMGYNEGTLRHTPHVQNQIREYATSFSNGDFRSHFEEALAFYIEDCEGKLAGGFTVSPDRIKEHIVRDDSLVLVMPDHALSIMHNPGL